MEKKIPIYYATINEDLAGLELIDIEWISFLIMGLFYVGNADYKSAAR